MIMSRLSSKEKNEIIRQIQNYFEQERDETIGNLAAEQLLDFMLKQIGPHIYNKAVFDARGLFLDRMAQLDEDLYTLEKPIRVR